MGNTNQTHEPSNQSEETTEKLKSLESQLHSIDAKANDLLENCKVLNCKIDEIDHFMDRFEQPSEPESPEKHMCLSVLASEQIMNFSEESDSPAPINLYRLRRDEYKRSKQRAEEGH